MSSKQVEDSKASLELYEQFSGFLKEVPSQFDSTISGGVYFRFANTGRGGEKGWFNFGLRELLFTLRDILKQRTSFLDSETYEEKRWRNLGSKHFSDAAARSIITVQTKPFFTLLAKTIHWSNGKTANSFSDGTIDLTAPSLKSAISAVEQMVVNLAPEVIALNASDIVEVPATAATISPKNLREDFDAALKAAHFVGGIS